MQGSAEPPKGALLDFSFFMSDFSTYRIEVVSIALEGQLPTTDHQGIIKVPAGQFSGAPNENIVQNHLNIALINVF